MSDERRLSPVELLRQLAFSLASLAAEGVSTGAVRGAAEGLQAELPPLDGQLRELLHDVLTILSRLAEETANRPVQEPGTWPRIAAEGAVHGAFTEFRRLNPEVQATIREVLRRVNVWLERSAEAEASRAEDHREPGFRARIAAAGVVEGVVSQLVRSVPELAPLAAQVAAQAGRGFITGIGEKAQEHGEDLTAFLDRSGRVLIRAVVEELDAELKTLPGDSLEQAGAAVTDLAGRAAAATVRGAFEELTRQLRALSRAGEPPLRRASREFFNGVFAALNATLRKPLAVMAGAGGVLLVTTLLVTRTR